jgi:hypothetical protein
MKISADILRRLSALNLPGDGLTSVLSILADIQIERTQPGDEGINLADDFGLITPQNCHAALRSPPRESQLRWRDQEDRIGEPRNRSGE